MNKILDIKNRKLAMVLAANWLIDIFVGIILYFGLKKTVFEFATRSKDIIKRIANRKPGEKMEDILQEIQEVLSSATTKIEEEEEKPTQPEPEVTENNDILADI